MAVCEYPINSMRMEVYLLRNQHRSNNWRDWPSVSSSVRTPLATNEANTKDVVASSGKIFWKVPVPHDRKVKAKKLTKQKQTLSLNSWESCKQNQVKYQYHMPGRSRPRS